MRGVCHFISHVCLSEHGWDDSGCKTFRLNAKTVQVINKPSHSVPSNRKFKNVKTYCPQINKLKKLEHVVVQ